MSPGGSPSTSSPARLDVPDPDDLPSRLFPPLTTPTEWSLEGTRALLAELGDPQRASPSLHVGGTNGKGSVAAVWSRILRSRGLAVGLYTSPHLCSFAERYEIDGRPAPARLLLDAADEIREGILRHGLSFFEAATVLAFHLFRREAVDVAIVEVGLGGRLDATNVLTPGVTAVTNVALDHAEFLGDSVGAIAREKAGIVKEGVPVITAETDPEPLAILRRAARERGAPFHRLRPDRDLRDVEIGPRGTRFVLETTEWGELELVSPLVGRHHAVNVALAVRALELPDDPRLVPTATEVRDGVRELRWPGRLQVERRRGRTWVLDVAHNPAGVRALTAALDELEPPRPRVVLVGVLGDKDWKAMLPGLFRYADRAVLTVPPGVPDRRRWDPERAVRSLEDLPPLEIVEPFGEALERVVEVSAPGGSVVVTGSHYTVGGALRALGLPPCEG